MKLKYDFVVRSVADKMVAIPVGDATEDFNCMITLNETGAFIFELLKEETSKEKLLEAFLNEYDATAEQAESAIDSVLKKLKETGIVE